MAGGDQPGARYRCVIEGTDEQPMGYDLCAACVGLDAGAAPVVNPVVPTTASAKRAASGRGGTASGRAEEPPRTHSSWRSGSTMRSRRSGMSGRSSVRSVRSNGFGGLEGF